jgi:hypothetical protein
VSALRFVLPMPENIANARQRGWRGLHGRKKKYFKSLDELQALGLVPRPPRQPFAKATISAVMHLGGAMDEGNALHRCEKWPCDWLKTRGYIVDDRRSCLTWEGLPQQIVKRTGEYFIEFTLTPL